MAESTLRHAAESAPINNAVKLVGEVAFLPGTSQLLDGNIMSGAVHAVLGCVAGALLGAPGVLLVAANSFTQSVTGRSLYTQVDESLRRS